MKFREPHALNDVARFHEVFDLPIEDQPIIPSPDRCALRVNLLEEELNELKEAIANNDMTEVADAFADLQYVLSGAILEFGLGDRFRAIFDEVQRSNMSKVCSSRQEAEETLSHYRTAKGTEGTIVEKNGEYLVFRVSDRKVLKSVNYSAADVEGLLKSQDTLA